MIHRQTRATGNRSGGHRATGARRSLGVRTLAATLALTVTAIHFSLARASTDLTAGPTSHSTSGGKGSSSATSSAASAAGLTATSSGQTSPPGTSSAVPSAPTSRASNSPIETKGQFAVDVLTFLHKSPLTNVKSYFTDIASTSSAWGYVALALQYGLFKPDAPHRVGVDDSVTGSLLAFAAARLYGVPMSPIFTATDWAESIGLLSESDLTNAEGLSTARVNSFLQAMSAWAAGQRVLPHSWSLSATDATSLSDALNLTGQAPAYQLSVLETKTIGVNLTAAGLKIPADVQFKADSAKQSSVMKSTVESSWAAKTQTATTLISQTMAAANSAIAAKPSAKPRQTTPVRSIYVNGSNVYVNDGTGWKRGTVSSSTTALLQSLGGSLLVSGFMEVTIAPPAKTTTAVTANGQGLAKAVSTPGTLPDSSPTQGSTPVTGSTTYTATLQPAVMGKIMSAVFQSAGLKPTPSLIGHFVKDTLAKVVLTVAPTGQEARLVHETWTVNITVPSSDFNSLTGNQMTTDENAAFVSGVQSVIESMTTDVTLGYRPIVIAKPSGLPASAP